MKKADQNQNQRSNKLPAIKQDNSRSNMNKYFDKLASTEIQRVNITHSSAHTQPKIDITPKPEQKLIELHNLKHLIQPQNSQGATTNIDNPINNNLRVILDKDDV